MGAKRLQPKIAIQLRRARSKVSIAKTKARKANRVLKKWEDRINIQQNKIRRLKRRRA